MRFLYLNLCIILAIVLTLNGDDVRSDIYTAAALIMAYISARPSND